jgi:hypothetical protein
MTRSNSKAASSSRSGWQLIELSMVIAVMAMISVLATKLIIVLMAIETRSGQSFQDTATLARLGEQWRSDLHRSSEATIAGDGKTCALQQANGETVLWTIDGVYLRREQRAAGRKKPLRETYSASARDWQFAKTGRLFSLVREFGPPQVTGPGAASAPSMTERIEAAQGTLQPGRQEGAVP